MSKKVYALSTARAGSKSVRNKNIMKIRGKPLYLHNLLESMETPEIKETFISTDIEQVFTDSSEFGFKVIRRPDALCQDASTHTETIYHGLHEIEKHIGEKLEILVVMLGNTMNMDRNIIKQALDIMDKDKDIDSVITVIKANHFNPMRAYVDNGNNDETLTTYLPQDEIKRITSEKHLSDKNSAGDILFQNGLWIIRRQTVIEAWEKNVGLQPFPWFGDKVKYLVQPPHLQEVDDIYQVKLLS